MDEYPLKYDTTSFASDNAAGIHPRILDAIRSKNRRHAPSYGMDESTEEFRIHIKSHFGQEAEGFLVFNGTAANVLGVSACLQRHEALIVSDTSHFQLDECGAPERFLGTKLYTVAQTLGKIDIENLKTLLIRKGDQHYAQPRVLSLTQPTEYGTTYSISELKDFRALCDKHGLYLHIDGARLANAAVSLATELKNITTDVGVDVVSFGGTKNGLLAGEAVVFLNKELAANFKFLRKQGLNLASKHRFLAAQFNAYLSDNLWKEIAGHTHSLAMELAMGIRKFPTIEVIAPVQSNAVFAKVPKSLIHPLRKCFFFYVWDEFENVVRWMTAFDHTREDIQAFIDAMESFL